MSTHAMRRTIPVAVLLASLGLLLPVARTWAQGSDPTRIDWQTPLGPGGAIVPKLPPIQSDTLGITRVEAAVFLDGQEILFVGTQDPDEPVMDPDEMLDVFVTAYRSLSGGEGPGVTIDPTPDQTRRGYRDGDLMSVLYFGAAEHTELGVACFDADRDMKSLGMEKDNITKASVLCPGIDSELALAARQGGRRERAWHRFWIEFDGTEQAHTTPAGDAIFVSSRFVVKTQYMVARGGQLVPGRARPDPVANEFASQLTRNYDRIGDCLPSFKRLLQFAPLVVLAEAARPGGKNPGKVPDLDEQWLLFGHPTSPAVTATQTPATVATKSGQGNTIIEIRGGVSLQPDPTYVEQRRRQKEIVASIRLAVRSAPDRGAWKVEYEGRTYVAVSRSLIGNSPRLWQSDLRHGSVEMVREQTMEARGPRVDDYWQIRVPWVRLSDFTGDYETLGTRQRAAYIREPNGNLVTLDNVATLTMPFNSSTFGYAGKHDDSLYIYTNRWVYVSSGVEFFSSSTGEKTIQIPEGEYYLEFDPNPSHHVTRARTSGSDIRYAYENGLLATVSDTKGNRVQLTRDKSGTLQGLSASDGRRIHYVRDGGGRLLAAADGTGQIIEYEPSRSTGAPLSFAANFTPGLPVSRPRFGIRRTTRWDELLRQSRELSDRSKVYVAAGFVAGSSKAEVRVAVGGVAVEDPGKVELHVEALLTGEDPDRSHAKALRSLLLDAEASRGVKNLVFVGHRTLREGLAQALLRLDKNRIAFTADDPTRAADRLGAAYPVRGGARIVRLGDGGTETTVEGGEDAGVVIFAGHNSPALLEEIEKFGENGKLWNRAVILFQCGNAETPGLVSRILKDYGAWPVLSYSEPISAKLLPALTSHLKSKLSNAGELVNLQSVLREVLDELHRKFLRGELPGIDGRDLKALEDGWSEQIGLNRPPGAGLVLPRAA